MANPELLNNLHQRMSAEQEQYRNWLLGQPPSDILDHAAEYTVREDIVMEMSALELTDAQANALLKSKTPLADVYKEWSKAETHHMDDVRDVIEARADSVIRTEKEKASGRNRNGLCHAGTDCPSQRDRPADLSARL